MLRSNGSSFASRDVEPVERVEARVDVPSLVSDRMQIGGVLEYLLTSAVNSDSFDSTRIVVIAVQRETDEGVATGVPGSRIGNFPLKVPMRESVGGATVDGYDVQFAATCVIPEEGDGFRFWESFGLRSSGTPLVSMRPPCTRATSDSRLNLSADDHRWATADPHELQAAEVDVAYSDCHLRRKLTAYGLETVPETDAYRWPAEAPDEPAAW